MNGRTYVVTGASGRVGGAVARGLLEAGHRVRAIGRDPGRLAALEELGASAHVGDVCDRDFVAEAFRGSDAALLVTSGDHFARDFRRTFADAGESYAEAARRTGLRAAVFVSTIGAHDDRHRGLVLVHGDVERALDEVPSLAVLHLRAPAFLENLFYFLPTMLARGGLYTPIDPDATFDMMPVADVAAVALRLLLALDFSGKQTLELRERTPLSLRRVAEHVAAVLARPFPAGRTTRDEDVERLVGEGLGRDFAHLMNDTWDTFSHYGHLRAPEPCRSTTGHTAIESFVRDTLAPMLTAGAGRG